MSESNIKLETQPKKERVTPLKSLKEYFSQLYLVFCLVSITWVLANNDHFLIKILWSFVISSSMIFRTISFFRNGSQCYLIEMCYIITAYSIYVMWFKNDVKCVLPFLYGPLGFYTLAFGDAANFNDLAKSTTFILHSGGAIVFRRLYRNGNPLLIAKLEDLTFNTFQEYFIDCLKLYFMWAIPYYLWLFFTNWKLVNMAKYTFGILPQDNVSVYLKLKYCFLHLILVTIALSIGILLMHCEILSNIFVACLVISGFLQGASYDFVGHRINFYKLFAKAYLYTKVELKKKIENLSANKNE